MRFRKGQRVWLVSEDGGTRPGRFCRYLGQRMCRLYLVNDGFCSVPLAWVRPRKAAVDGRTLEVVK